MEILYKVILESKSLEPIVVENKREGAKHLSELVSGGIKESNHFIPIITSNSINSQWVNQEIGFAKALERNIIPVLENNLISELKGFIHNQIQLSYNYSIEKKEISNFKKCCIALIKDIDNVVIDIDKPENKSFVENQIKNGELYICDENFWIVFENVRYLISDTKTLDRIKQMKTITSSTSISFEQFKKVKEGQEIKSKGPINPSLGLSWGPPKRNNRY